MTRSRAIAGLLFVCALLFGAVAAQAAEAANHGQTAFTCANLGGTTHTFGDSDCETTTGAGAYEHVAFTGETDITGTSAGSLVLTVPQLHGVANVVVKCIATVEEGTAENTEPTPGFMKAIGEGDVKFSSCTAPNQTACGVTVAAAEVEAETVEGLKEEMGKVTDPKSGMGVEFKGHTSATFTGATCMLRFFGAIPITGSAIATPEGRTNGMGANAKFINERVTAEEAGNPSHTTNEMSKLTVGGETAYLEGTVSVLGANGMNWLVLTTS
jgi:hypothetical protein